MYLIKQDLINLEACNEAVEWFEQEFPTGIALDYNSLAICPRGDWICWLACKLSKDYRFWCAGVAFREASKVHSSLAQYSMNVTPRNWRDAANAADAYAADAYAADAANAAVYAAYVAKAAAKAAANAAANAAAYAAADAADAAYAADADADAADFYKEIREEAERILVTL